jgi:hypothetical protein
MVIVTARTLNGKHIIMNVLVDLLAKVLKINDMLALQ